MKAEVDWCHLQLHPCPCLVRAEYRAAHHDVSAFYTWTRWKLDSR